MKKLLFFLACAAMMVSFAACSGNDPEANAPEGAIKGLFSVSRNKQVYFSKGNLRATFNGSNWTWEFAKNQWDFIGNNPGNNTIKVNGTVPANDVVDLFGWSTPANNFGISRSTESSDYTGTFKDWGNNIGEGWCTLSKAEWVYLFHQRDKAEELFGLGTVNGINGAIILPDKWSLPAGITFNSAKDKNFEWQDNSYYYNSAENNFTLNAYTAEQWSVMESAGAVFLPAAGFREGTAVNKSVGSTGYYWSSTPNGDEKAHYLFFGSAYLDPRSSYYRYYGRAVRLVKPMN